MGKFYFLNGDILPADETKLHVSDLAVLRGYGIFDFFRTSLGRPAFIEDYLIRFLSSAAGFFLEHPYTDRYIRKQVEKLISLNGFAESGVKLVMTGGYSSNGFDPGKPNFIIMVDEFIEPDRSYYEKGVKLITLQHVRQFPHVKSTNYLSAILNARTCKEQGAIDTLYHNGEKISETTRSNFFLVKDKTVITPAYNILSGVTRRITLQLAEEHYRVEEREVGLDEIDSASEAFITSSTKRIMPVVKINDKIIGNGQPGNVTRHLEKLFFDFERDYVASLM